MAEADPFGRTRVMPARPVASAATLASARALALAVPALLLAGAYLSQVGFGLYACEMCWWQRYAHFAALALAALAFLAPVAARRALVALAALAIAVSGLIGGYHAGVEWGWWPGMTRCATTAVSGGDPLAAILAAPLVRCDVAQWRLAGISLAGWNFLFSLAGAAAVAALLAGGWRHARDD